MKKSVVFTFMVMASILVLIPAAFGGQTGPDFSLPAGLEAPNGPASTDASVDAETDAGRLAQMRPRPRRGYRELPPPSVRKSRYGYFRRTFGFGGRFIFSHYMGDDFRYDGRSIDMDMETGVGLGANFTLFPVPFFSMEFSVNYIFTELESDSRGYTETLGDLVQVPILFTARFHFPAPPAVSPYLGMGLGYYINSFDAESDSIRRIYDRRGDLDLDNSFGFHIAGGVELFVVPVGAITIDMKYVWTEADVDTTIPYFDDESIDLSRFEIGVGYKMYF